MWTAYNEWMFIYFLIFIPWLPHLLNETGGNLTTNCNNRDQRQFNKTFAVVIQKCMYCLRGWKQIAMVVNYTCKSFIELNPELHSDILSFPYLVVFCLFQKAKFKENVIPKHKRERTFKRAEVVHFTGEVNSVVKWGNPVAKVMI